MHVLHFGLQSSDDGAASVAQKAQEVKESSCFSTVEPQDCSRYVPDMVRRSTPQATKDELAFPVRVKIAVPPLGLGKALDEAHHWLKDEVGSGRFAVHSQPGFACETAAFYFCAVQDAQRFLSAFPALEMADGTISLRRLAS